MQLKVNPEFTFKQHNSKIPDKKMSVDHTDIKFDLQTKRLNFEKQCKNVRIRPLCGPISISRANAHMVYMGLKSSTSHYTLFS